ncbi:sensor histidine kinase [Xylocopilactobacillus apicola]|nr:GHKL domain-containing protein [Xylocopilactobacillus apicola]
MLIQIIALEILVLALELNVFLFFTQVFNRKSRILIVVANALTCLVFLFFSRPGHNQYMINEDQYFVIAAVVIYGFYLILGQRNPAFTPLLLFFIIENIFVLNLIHGVIRSLPIRFFSYASALNLLIQLGLTLLMRSKLQRIELFDTRKKRLFSIILLVAVVVLQLFPVFFVQNKVIDRTIEVNSSSKPADMPPLKTKNVSQFNQSFLVFVLFILLVVGYVSYEVSKTRRNKRLELEKSMMENYVGTLEKMQLDIKKVQHDYKNMLLGINGFVDEDEINREALKDFLAENQLRQNAVQLKTSNLDDLKNINLPIIKGLISTKIVQAGQKGIRVIVECLEAIQIQKVDPFDLARALGIILDNAIEESEKQEQGEIRIVLLDDEAKTTFIISNTCLKKVSNFGVSTKGQNRGLGLKNLKEIVENNHHLQLETTWANYLFTQKLTIRK